MFHKATAFNGDISAWDVSNATDMRWMFNEARAFNQDISSWNVSNVTDMTQMFVNATAFNQDIGSWDTSSVAIMDLMFFSTSNFNQDLSGWCVTNIVSEPTDFATDAALTNANFPIWGTCPNTSLNLNDQDVTNILIYPNPAVDRLFIQGLSDATKVSIYNILGKLVVSKTTSKEIDVDNLQSGVYIVKIVDEQKEIVKKFIKK
jgi:surface protein